VGGGGPELARLRPELGLTGLQGSHMGRGSAWGHRLVREGKEGDLFL